MADRGYTVRAYLRACAQVSHDRRVTHRVGSNLRAPVLVDNPMNETSVEGNGENAASIREPFITRSLEDNSAFC